MRENTHHETLNNILATLTAHAARLRELGVIRLGVFGSYAKNTQTTTSDIDFLVAFDDYTFDRHMDVLFYLEDLFACEVDLVPAHAIKPRIREQILSEVVYAEGLSPVSG